LKLTTPFDECALEDCMSGGVQIATKRQPLQLAERSVHVVHLAGRSAPLAARILLADQTSKNERQKDPDTVSQKSYDGQRDEHSKDDFHGGTHSGCRLREAVES
jgi:hypothetical protein